MQQQHSDTQHSKQASRVGRDPKMCFWFDVTYVVDWPFRESTTYSYRVTTPNVPLTLQLDLSSSTPLPLRTIPDGISIRLTRLNDWASTRSPSSLQFNFIKCRRVSFFSVRLQNKTKKEICHPCFDGFHFDLPLRFGLRWFLYMEVSFYKK